MANFVFNVSKGRVAELYNRVKSNDPAASTLRVIALVVTGDQDAAMKDADTVSDLLGLPNVLEASNTGYTTGGVSLTDADLAALSPNDTSDLQACDTGDITFSSISASPDWTDVVFVYDPDNTFTTTACIPLTCNDFAVSPDGSDITVQVADFFRATD